MYKNVKKLEFGEFGTPARWCTTGHRAGKLKLAGKFISFFPERRGERREKVCVMLERKHE